MSTSDERKTPNHGSPGTSASAKQEPVPLPSGPAGSSRAETGSASGTPAAATESRSQGEPQISSSPVSTPSALGVYFFPDRVVTEDEVRKLLASGSKAEQAEVVSRLLTYAEYDEIWTWTDRETVRDLFDQVEMPERLRAAWARNLGLVAKA